MKPKSKYAAGTVHTPNSIKANRSQTSNPITNKRTPEDARLYFRTVGYVAITAIVVGLVYSLFLVRFSDSLPPTASELRCEVETPLCVNGELTKEARATYAPAIERMGL